MRVIPMVGACALIVMVPLSVAMASDAGTVGTGGLPEAAGGDWLSRVQAGIRDHEYRFELGPASYRPQLGTVYQAPNRVLDLRLYLDDEGVVILERSTDDAPNVMNLVLVGWGREGVIDESAPGALREEDGRVQRLRGDLTESYFNSAAGLELGWEVHVPPAGDGELVLLFELRYATARPRGGGVEIVSSGGRNLLLQAVQAVDRHGRHLPAKLVSPGRGTLQLRIADGGAPGPLKLKTLLTGTADSLLQSDQDNAWMGSSVATAGDVNGDGFADIIVGAPYYDNGQGNEGAAFVFLGSEAGIVGSGPADAFARLESNQASAEFGSSVATAGDVNGDGLSDIVVGAPSYDDGHSNEGAAFVFLSSATGIVGSDPTTAHAHLQSNRADASMGSSVATAGDVNGDGFADVVIGAHCYDSWDGAAFVFLGSAAGIVGSDPATAHAWLQSDQANTDLGNGVATAGDVNGDGYADIIVGAPNFDLGHSDVGAAYVFHGSASGIVASGPTDADARVVGLQQSDQVGFSVSTAGDVNGDGYADVIVGARYFVSDRGNRGAALVFLGSGAGLIGTDPTTAHALLVSDQNLSDMGFSVATAGDVNGDGFADVIVGAPKYDRPSGGDGSAFLYHGSASGIVGSGPADANVVLAAAAGYNQGHSVATAGDVNGDGYADVIVGNPGYYNGSFDGGAALLYLGSAAGVSGSGPTEAHARLESDQDGADMAWSVATAGDVNGDSFADVIVGAPGYDNGESNEGAAFVFLGSAGGVVGAGPADAHARLESNQEDAAMGSSVATAGDVNGDGFADVVIGAPGFDNVEPNEGAAFVFLGSSAGLAGTDPTTAHAQLESDQEGAAMGASVATAGDVNGDGFADLVIGAPGYDNGESDEGAAFVFLGSGAGIVSTNPATAHAQLESDQGGAAMGSSVSTAGDVNGDGFADLVIGAPGYDNGESDEGAAFVFLGSGAGTVGTDPSTAHTQLESNQQDAAMGSSVSTAGDVNGDSLFDIVVGAPGFDNDQTDEGAAFVFLGSNLGVVGTDPGTAQTQLESNQQDAAMGSSVSTAGDVNGDGFADIVVGAPGYDSGETDEGAAFVFLGYTGGVLGTNPADAQARLGSDQSGASMGGSVATAGDVNGDGFADVVVGASSYDSPEPNEGAAFVFLGNTHARPVLARQYDGVWVNNVVQPWGSSALHGGFGVQLTAISSRGRELARLQVEACPSGSPWGTSLCQSWLGSGWVDTEASTDGVVLEMTTSGLYPGLYRWRARTQHLPFSADQSSPHLPPNPGHGPWRRHGAQALEADIRVLEGCDLKVTIDDGQATVVPGEVVTYTISASNPGPVDVSGAAVSNTLPASLTGVSWSCLGSEGGVCTPSGSGVVADTVDLPRGATVTYTLDATVNPGAVGSLASTATVNPPPSMVEVAPGDNIDTDTDLLAPEADLAITVDDGSDMAVVGREITYIITASNPGPSDAPGATVSDHFSVDLTAVSWTCAGTGGGVCAASGLGDIAELVDLPAGAATVFTATATVDPAATGPTLENQATVACPAAVTERNPANNTDTDTDTVWEVIFEDGFEGGDTGSWSSAIPGVARGGSLTF